MAEHLRMFALSVLIVTFAIIALLEIGDKTQLVVIALACRTRQMGRVASGSTLGISLVIVLGVAIGTVLDFLIPIGLLDTGGAITFIGLGLALLAKRIRSKEEKDRVDNDQTSGTKGKGSHAFLGAAASVGFMEFGDKTQVATITLAATYDSPLSVALGAILAQAMLMVVAAFVGAKLLGRIRKSILDYVSSALFIIVGLYMMFF
jgi:putative Ca2+/H+ antiporter (TMEM165/GDT1 family)